MIFKWIIQNQRLCMFVEPYHTPYASKHRYWTGLLLLVHVIVQVISAADVSSDHGITLLSIGVIVYILSMLVCVCRPYQNWPVQVLEMTCYANIVCFCLATFYVSKVKYNCLHFGNYFTCFIPRCSSFSCNHSTILHDTAQKKIEEQISTTIQ